MNFPFPVPNLSKALFSSCFTFALCALAGCNGGVLKFTAGASASVLVPENTDGKVWQASLVLDGPGSLTGVSYMLSGPDQDKFSINTSTGDILLREAADFEQPADADKNNEYRVNIEASANNQTVTQSLQVQVTDVSLPKVELIQPKLNENIAKGADFTAQVVVRLYDAESNQTLSAGSVHFNGQPLLQDAANGQLFKGDVEVPAAGIDVLLEGAFAGAHRVSAKGKFFNIKSAISPVNFGVVPGKYIFYLDNSDSSVSKLNLKTALSNRYVRDERMPSSAPVFDFNSSHQAVYTILDAGGGVTALSGFLVGQSTPGAVTAGCTQDSILNITFDGLNKRILIVTQDDKSASGEYNVLSLAADEKTALVNAYSNMDCRYGEFKKNSVWRMSSDIVKGKFKQFAFHRVSGTFVVADERVYAGQTITVLQGFSEAGEKRFEAKVGPDISNITINNPKGIIYVAENRSSVDGKIKAIEVATGKVSDLLPAGENNYIGAYSEIRIDNVNQLLYIADAVSDAFFVVDLVSNSLNNLGAQRSERTFVE